jgi:hypothetical protein
MNRLDSAQIYIFPWENDALLGSIFFLKYINFHFQNRVKGRGEEGWECILEPKCHL